jgi:hypothetical protein
MDAAAEAAIRLGADFLDGRCSKRDDAIGYYFGGPDEIVGCLITTRIRIFPRERGVALPLIQSLKFPLTAQTH